VRDHLAELAKSGTQAVVVVPAGFVSDHMEVRHDLDVEAAETADGLGLAFARAATPGTSPRFASMITELVRERMAQPEGTQPGRTQPGRTQPGRTLPDTTVSDNPALGDMGVPRQTCPADCCGGRR
jgi:ferrochelatase